MRDIAELPDDLQQRLKDRDLIVFDGVCVLCETTFRFVLSRDKAQRFSFATAQSDLGQSLFAALGLPTDDFETNLVIIEGTIYSKAQGAGAVLHALGGWGRLLGWLRHMPPRSTDWAYHLIARHRYRLFGQRDTCIIPDANLRSRFLT